MVERRMNKAERDAPDRASMRRATSAEVAHLAGVSRSAVSRTFTLGASVSPETRRKVLDAATALRYRPNQLARSLIMNRSLIVAVAISYLDNHYYPQVLERLSAWLSGAGYRMLLFITHGEQHFDPVLEELLRYRVDGVILASSAQSLRLAQECVKAHVPVMMFNTADRAAAIPSVIADNLKAGSVVTEYLIAAGHRRIGYIAGIAGESTSDDREAGIAQTLSRHGLPPHRRAAGNFNIPEALSAFETLRAGDDPPDAVICANDHMALAVLQVARVRLGLRPGQDISIIGFDGVEIGASPGFDLTTYAQPIDLMVEALGAGLMRMIDSRSTIGEQVVVDGDLVVRASARRPASGMVLMDDGREIWRPKT
jgi:DNA-binding LacI/PurR family transcriptional regulator